jgi:RND family efflux transporter MFP subunit
MATPPQSIKPDLGSLRIADANRKKSSSAKRWIWIVLLVIVVALGAVASSAFFNRKPEVEVTTARKPATGPSGVLNASGYVTPRRRATVAAKITGRVTSVHFDEGTRLQEGQLLATLDDSDARRALDSAKADRDSSQAAIADFEVQLRNAIIELHRAEELVKSGVQTQEALDNARTNADSLRAKIALAKQQVIAAEARIREQQQAVDNCVIGAPFAGIAVSKDAQVGEMVSPISAGGGFTRTGIATIVDLHSNEIEVDVSEAYIARVKADQPVNATLDAYPDVTFPGKVRTVIPTADRQKATVKVRISFTDANHVNLFDPAKDPRILPDMGVKVTFLEDIDKSQQKKADTATALSIVPAAAIRDDNGTKVVFAVKNDTIERHPVSVGAMRGAEVEVLTGLQPDTIVVIKGPENLKDGQEIQIKN